MSDRDLGNLHKYLDPEEKNFETVVFQQNKPLSSSENVLSQELRRQEGDKQLRENIDSGFVRGSFLQDAVQDYSFGTSANQFKLINKPVFHVNGWIAPLEFSKTTNDGENVIELDSPPTSSGEVGVDFVFLEVWRSLIQPDPSTTNKPANDKIYRHGNVQSPSGVWLDDDLKDNPISTSSGNETSIRVQIQYRIRSVRLATDNNRDGYSDSNVEAQGPNSSPQTGESFTHAPSSSIVDSNDKGLWIAGDEIGSGNEISGTVDGFVYSIPICLVYRRNSSGFDAMNNGNGGIDDVETAISSDRPDGYFSDQVVEEDIQDLRKASSLKGWDWGEVHDRNLNMLLDNNLKTWATNSAHTGWYVGGNNESVGTNYLKADDLVPDGVDNPSGNTIRNPDGVCRTFSDRSHAQKYVEVYSTGSNWSSGDTLNLDFTASGKNVQTEMPTGTMISDVNSVVIDESDGSGGIIDVPVQKVEGLGSLDSTVTIDSMPVSSSRDIWVEWEVEYPPGSGLTSHPKDPPSNFEMWFHNPSSFDSNIGTTLSTSSDVLQYMDISYEEPHREVSIEFRTDSSKTITVHSVDDTTVIIPEYPYLDGVDPNNTITVQEGGTPKTISAVSNRTITLQNALSSSNGVEVDVEYKPHNPLPDNNAEMTVYYRAPGIQAIPHEFLSDGSTQTQLKVEPVYLPDSMYAGITGTGSQGEAFPWPSPCSQIPVSYESAYKGEEELNAPSKISIDDFDAETGLLKLQTLVPLASVSEITLENPINITTENDEYIDHFAETIDTEYKPTVMAQPLSSRTEHKTFYPILAKLKRDTSFGKKGTVVMLVFSQYHDYISSSSTNKIDENNVVFDNKNSCVGVFKIKGNILS